MSETNNIELSAWPHCPYTGECGLLDSIREKLPRLVGRFQGDYCSKNHLACARRWVVDFLGTEQVPELMMPHQHDWAEQVLLEAGVRYGMFQNHYHSLRFQTGSSH